MNNETTAWYNDDELPKDMIEGATGRKANFSQLESSKHFQKLKEVIDSIKFESMADLGCGAGEVGRVFMNQFDYTGFDLPHIITKVAKILNPGLDFRNFDANETDFSFLSNYDLVLCNGFISELTKSLEILGKIMDNAKEYIVIHRQIISNKTKLEDYVTYADLNTPRALIGKNDFSNILEEKGFESIYNEEFDWGNTILIKRK